MNPNDIIWRESAGSEIFGAGNSNSTGGEKTRPLSVIDIRLQQRNGKKTMTLIEGLAEDLDLKKILRYLKRTMNTNGAVIRKKEEVVIMLQGDQRTKVYEFFTKFHVWEHPDPKMKIHGF